jgi:hypothetical protein
VPQKQNLKQDPTTISTTYGVDDIVAAAENREAEGHKAAFFPEGMAEWLNTIRPDGGREATVENLMSAEKVADELNKMFRQCVNWWGG